MIELANDGILKRRAAIVAEARSWAGTPYVVGGRVKGAGCDCGSFLISVAVACGLVTDEQLAPYSMDCWQHWKDEVYFKRIMRDTVKVLEGVVYRTTEILPGSLVLTRTATSSHFNHGGIVTAWPLIMHQPGPTAREADATSHHLWAYHPLAVFDFNALRGGA